MTIETLASMTPSGKWLDAIGAVTLIVLLAKHFVLDVSTVPETPDFPLRLAEWRTQASIERTEELPVSLNALILAEVTTR